MQDLGICLLLIEVRLFEAAYEARLPVLLKGPTAAQDAFHRTHGVAALRKIDGPRRALEVR